MPATGGGVGAKVGDDGSLVGEVGVRVGCSVEVDPPLLHH